MDDELEGELFKLTREEQASEADRVFRREMAVSAVEDLVRAMNPDYDRIYDGHYVDAAVDALIDAARRD